MSEMTTAERIDCAFKERQRDNRFRAMVDMCVAAAMNEHGHIDPDDAPNAAFDIATAAASLLLQRIYSEDAELFALRRERDAYKDAALRFSDLSPRPQIIVTKDA